LYWTTGGELNYASDPRPLVTSSGEPESDQAATSLSIELVKLERNSEQRLPPSRLFIQAVMTYLDGTISSTIYVIEEVFEKSLASLRSPAALHVPTGKEKHVKSSRFVEDEDDLLGFVVPDEPVLARVTTTAGSLGTGKTLAKLQTRDWSDIINLTDSTADKSTLAEALTQLKMKQEKMPLEAGTIRVLAEALDPIHISDVEEAADVLKEFERAQSQASDSQAARVYWQGIMALRRPLLEHYENAMTWYVQPVSVEVPERIKVQTERLCRSVAFDTYSSVIAQKQTNAVDHNDEMPPMDLLKVWSSPPASPPVVPRATESNSALAVLMQYTTFTEPSIASSSTTFKSLLAHLPNKLTDPATYSYTAVEETLRQERTQQELDELDDRARRKFERSELRKQRKETQQARLRDAVTQQSTFVPGLVFSPQRDPRDVQSSQLAPLAIGSSQPGLSMTQPERGTHGERRKVAKREGKARVKGF
jgi:hypothetical protein